jgi:pimeloyl-ACP methyl ester carboxylesterase
MPRSVVLVHGAYHGGWCFDRVLPLLSAAGIRAVAPDLPGHGADPGPFGDLYADADRVTQAIDSFGDDVVLLGHSYGGAVISQAGVHESVAHLVYLCAMVLDSGESCHSAGAAVGARTKGDGPSPIVGAMRPGPTGTTVVDPELARAIFFHDCTPADAAWATAQMGPQPTITMSQPVTTASWHDRPSTYVVCTDDQTVPPDYQRALARRCRRSVEWPTSHSPFLSQPALVADLLIELARA